MGTSGTTPSQSCVVFVKLIEQYLIYVGLFSSIGSHSTGKIAGDRQIRGQQKTGRKARLL
jgi:hypothetical protein